MRCVAAAACLLSVTAGAQALFDAGRIQFTDGSSENIRCTGYYTGDGNEIRMAIQCQSQTSSINLRSRLKIDGSKASGEWEERTFNASGSASGRVAGDSMTLGLSGGGVTGSMSVSFGKSQHSVSVSTQGIGLSKATITFNRR